MLLTTAARSTDDPTATVVEMMKSLGWTAGHSTPVTRAMASDAAWDTMTVLRRMDAVTTGDRATPDGALFTRAALTTWPRAGR